MCSKTCVVTQDMVVLLAKFWCKTKCGAAKVAVAETVFVFLYKVVDRFHWGTLFRALFTLEWVRFCFNWDSTWIILKLTCWLKPIYHTLVHKTSRHLPRWHFHLRQKLLTQIFIHCKIPFPRRRNCSILSWSHLVFILFEDIK